VKECVTMSNKDLDQLCVLRKTQAKEITQEKAGQFLNISSRQVRKLLYRLKTEGPKGIISRLLGKNSNRSKSSKLKDEVLSLLKTRYEGFGPKLAAEKLLEYEGIKISNETVRKWMIEKRLWVT
jgi:DNA-binding Lrp family transcriptional regulator